LDTLGHLKKQPELSRPRLDPSLKVSSAFWKSLVNRSRIPSCAAQKMDFIDDDDDDDDDDADDDDDDDIYVCVYMYILYIYRMDNRKILQASS
jgi:hypothetical protein